MDYNEIMKKSFHKTSTGKIFQLTDLNNRPVNYAEGKNVFTKSLVSTMEVDQIIRSKKNKLMLRRYK